MRPAWTTVVYITILRFWSRWPKICLTAQRTRPSCLRCKSKMSGFRSSLRLLSNQHVITVWMVTACRIVMIYPWKGFEIQKKRGRELENGKSYSGLPVYMYVNSCDYIIMPHAVLTQYSYVGTSFYSEDNFQVHCPFISGAACKSMVCLACKYLISTRAFFLSCFRLCCHLWRCLLMGVLRSRSEHPPPLTGSVLGTMCRGF